MSRLEEIKARCDAATPGPWEYIQADKWRDITICVENDYFHILKKDECNDADSQFILNARDDIPWLIAEVERLRESLDMWERLPVKIEHEPMSKIASRQHVVLKDVLNTLKGTAFHGREILEAKINQALNMYNSTE